MTRLTQLYRQLWLKENLPTWLLNVLQLYRRDSDLWQTLLAKFATIEADYEQYHPAWR